MINKRLQKADTRYSFAKGYEQLAIKDAKNARMKIMKIFGITTSASFLLRLKGLIVPNMIEYERITALFKSYGITDIWGAKKTQND